MRVIISEEFDCVLRGNSMLLHIVINQRISQDFPCGFPRLPPGRSFPLQRGLSSLPSSLSWVSFMFGRVTPFLVADETLVVPHVFSLLTGGEVDPVDVHGIWVRVCSLSGQRDVVVASSSEPSESYHILVKLSCLIEPLFPFPAQLLLSLGQSGGSHHDGKLLGYSLLVMLWAWLGLKALAWAWPERAWA